MEEGVLRKKKRKKKILKEQTKERKFPSNFLCSWDIPFFTSSILKNLENHISEKTWR